MNWLYAELVAVALAAMVSPTTLIFSMLALVLGDRPLRTGFWFYVGALGATLAVGVLAAFVIGDAATSHTSTPKTWVAIVDVVVGVIGLVFAVHLLRRPGDPKQMEGMVERMGKVASSPVVAIIGAGAALANPGAFIPIALKTISETDPSAPQYVVDWVFFSLVSLLPLAVALLLVLVARDWAERVLASFESWLVRRARTVAALILVLLAATLLRNGISGLVN